MSEDGKSGHYAYRQASPISKPMLWIQTTDMVIQVELDLSGH